MNENDHDARINDDIADGFSKTIGHDNHDRDGESENDSSSKSKDEFSETTLAKNFESNSVDVQNLRAERGTCSEAWHRKSNDRVHDSDTDWREEFVEFDECDKRNYCFECHDEYQFGNFTIIGDSYESLKINFPRYDEYFEIAKFYADNGHLTIKQVNVLLNYLTEDYSQSASISFEDKDIEDSDERTILMSRIKHIRIYERLFRKKKVNYCPSLISCWSILTKLRDDDKENLYIEHLDWSFYSRLFDRSKDIVGYDVYSPSVVKSRCETSEESMSIREEIVWFWKPVEDEILFPRGRLLTTNHLNFDVPFYIALFYLNYKHLTTIHLHFIHSSTLDVNSTDKLPLLTAMSKVWFDTRSTKASRWKLALEQYLQDALRYSRADIYHHLLHNNILRIWRYVSTRKFINKYLGLFDTYVREPSYPNRFRTDRNTRSYVLSRIMQYRFTRSRKFNENQIRIVIHYFVKWIRDGLYQMAYPCSFFASRDTVWRELITTRHFDDEVELAYLDRTSALRDLPSINSMRANKKRYIAERRTTSDGNSRVLRNLLSSSPSPLEDDERQRIQDNLETTERTIIPRNEDYGLDVTDNTSSTATTRRSNSNSSNIIISNDAVRFSLQPKSEDDKIIRFLNILFFTGNPSEVFSVSRIKVKLYHEHDRENFTADLSALKMWDDVARVEWSCDRTTTSLRDFEFTVDTASIYKYVEKRLSIFLNPKTSPSLFVFLHQRELGISGDFKMINFTHWKEYGFENQCELSNARIYPNRYFYDDILKVMSIFLIK